MSILFGTSGTIEGIKQVIEKFYCGTQFEILENGELRRVSDDKILDGVIVRKKGKRYRFETIE